MTDGINSATPRPPAGCFVLSAPAMIFGHDIVENAQILADVVQNIEIVLFHTPTQNNFLSPTDIRRLAQIARQHPVSYTVHLPDSLQIASTSAAKRSESIGQILQLIEATEAIAPLHYVLHVPFTPPTLVPVPGLYLTSIPPQECQDWLKRAVESLSIIIEARGPAPQLLVENINYSPIFLEPLIRSGFCKICLDIGHLLLGQESVMTAMKRYDSQIREIHLHGIKDDLDHYSLAHLPQERLTRWMAHFIHTGYDGILNLEVFSPQDLMVSLELIGRSPKNSLRHLFDR